MIPMTENGWKYWTREHAKWCELAETALDMEDMESFNRCMKQADLCLFLRDQEAQGVVVVSGRKGIGVVASMNWKSPLMRLGVCM